MAASPFDMQSLASGLDADGSATTSFPIKTTHKQSISPTTPNLQVLYTEFANKHFVVVTEFNRIGSLTEASIDTQPRPASTPTVSTRTLLGSPSDPLPQTYASHILSMIHAKRPTDTRPLLLGVALTKRKRTPEEEEEEDYDMAIGEREQAVFKEAMLLCQEVGLW
ncbi:hypothetical protein DFS34DRAFT_593870 [Phlyctochytrium arcticum]|nr:hypothetical protein DFS34DRAFT_593870 [Phlyctochytrium arcticum]